MPVWNVCTFCGFTIAKTEMIFQSKETTAALGSWFCSMAPEYRSIISGPETRQGAVSPGKELPETTDNNRNMAIREKWSYPNYTLSRQLQMKNIERSLEESRNVVFKE